jgi:hypothetical protein
MRTVWATLLLVAAFTVLVVPASGAVVVEVKVTRGGALVGGAKVWLEPAGIPASALTGADGKAKFKVATAGKYTAAATITAAGVQYGAVREFSVGATNVGVPLALTEAITYSEWVPFAVGDTWVYHEATTEAGVTHTATRTSKMVGWRGVGRDRSMVTQTTWSGSPDVLREYTRLIPGQGYFIVGEDRTGSPPRNYNPPMHVRDLLPVGYVFKTSAKFGTPATAVTITGRIVGFDDISVQAGRYRHCAHLKASISSSGHTESSDIWIAKGVGWVRVRDASPGKTSQRDLMSKVLH